MLKVEYENMQAAERRWRFRFDVKVLQVEPVAPPFNSFGMGFQYMTLRIAEVCVQTPGIWQRSTDAGNFAICVLCNS